MEAPHDVPSQSKKIHIHSKETKTHKIETYATLKRDLCTLKRDLCTLKRDLCTLKRDVLTDHGSTSRYIIDTIALGASAVWNCRSLLMEL